MEQKEESKISLRPWSEGDLPLLQQTIGDAEMTQHLGGPETDEQLEKRHKRYVELAGTGKGEMFVITLDSAPEPVGSVGYWETEWQGQTVYEMGWAVLPAYQGQGLASRATRAAIDLLRPKAKHRFVHAYPSVDNTASNAVCRKAGFTLVDEYEFEYPVGHKMRCNDWLVDLEAAVNEME